MFGVSVPNVCWSCRGQPVYSLASCWTYCHVKTNTHALFYAIANYYLPAAAAQHEQTYNCHWRYWVCGCWVSLLTERDHGRIIHQGIYCVIVLVTLHLYVGVYCINVLSVTDLVIERLFAGGHQCFGVWGFVMHISRWTGSRLSLTTALIKEWAYTEMSFITAVEPAVLIASQQLGNFAMAIWQILNYILLSCGESWTISNKLIFQFNSVLLN